MATKHHIAKHVKKEERETTGIQIDSLGMDPRKGTDISTSTILIDEKVKEAINKTRETIGAEKTVLAGLDKESKAKKAYLSSKKRNEEYLRFVEEDKSE